MKKKQIIISVKQNKRVSCPTKDHENWNLHPRVFINFKLEKISSCPYCGTKFKLE